MRTKPEILKPWDVVITGVHQWVDGGLMSYTLEDEWGGKALISKKFLFEMAASVCNNDVATMETQEDYLKWLHDHYLEYKKRHD